MKNALAIITAAALLAAGVFMLHSAWTTLTALNGGKDRYMLCYLIYNNVQCIGYEDAQAAKAAFQEHVKRNGNVQPAWIASCFGQGCTASIYLPLGCGVTRKEGGK